MPRLTLDALRARVHAALGEPAVTRRGFDLASAIEPPPSPADRPRGVAGLPRPVRVFGAIGLGAVVAAGAIAAVSVGLSGSNPQSQLTVGPNGGGTSSPQPATSATQPTHQPTATPAPALPGGGFQPAAVTAISESDFWMLGTARLCSGCAPIIVRTTDGGATFSAIAPPPGQFADYSQGTATSISDLRFADAVDGWGFGPGLWATHDDGAHWVAIDLHAKVVDLEPGADGYVYAAVDTCATTQPTGSLPCFYEVERSPVTTDTWNVVLKIAGGNQPEPSLGVHGTDVWLMDTAGIWRSLDEGVSFTPLPNPCGAQLGGEIYPVSPTAVWAFCPTGMEGGPWLSTNGGESFTSEYGGAAYPNSARIGAVSASTAFVTGGGAVNETTDGGTTYRSISGFGGGDVTWLGFTDPTVGYALVESGQGTQRTLWRTGDAGARWSLVTVS
ncbi:MAG TPA: hypothetical protein VEK76_01570 [Candidatus Binatia bacterium]|nr:hypothetical protein [Candidatus Binatia bacterium]